MRCAVCGVKSRYPGVKSRYPCVKSRYPCVKSRYPCLGGDERTRTADPLLAKQVLYQLSYVPADVGNVAEKSLPLQHPSDIESTEHGIAAKPVAGGAGT